jgi:hypothetical protein
MKKKIIGIFICTLFIVSGISSANSTENNPPNIPSNPHPDNGAIDIGVKTHLSWTACDPDPGDKAIYDLYFGTESDPDLITSDLEKPNYYPGVLEHNTQYFWKIVAKDGQGASTTGPIWTFITNDCDCDPPEKPSGPTRVRNRNRYEYSTKIMNQNQNGWFYNFSWGDGNYSGWLGPYNHNERVRAEHQWEEPGDYQVQTRARIQNNFIGREEWIMTGWSEPLPVTVTIDNPTNEPPNAPDINGPTQGKPGMEYDFTLLSTDPDGDDVYYIINWGCCGSETHTYGPYISGEEAIVSHSWADQGTFTITAKAMDVYEAEGPESTFTIKMPRHRAISINSLFQWFLQKYPNLIPITQLLVQRLALQ